MAPSRSLAVAFVALAVAGAVPLLAQEEPLAAGSEGVPAPKRTKHVQPVYPPEAIAQGIRGIVILDLVIGPEGKVESATVVRSVPGLDEAAIAAARQWQYSVTKVDGKPVRVRLTVPVIFSLALPTLARQEGIPELRQGVAPAWPAGASGGGLATAEVTLEPDGRVGGAHILSGGAPWSDALLAALKTWRFSPPPEDVVLSFRVEAEFVSGDSGGQKRVTLQATGLQQSSLMGEPSPSAAQPSAPSSAAAVPTAPPPAAATATPPATTPALAPTQAAPPEVTPPPAAAPQPAPQAPPAPPAQAPPAPTRTAPSEARPTTPPSTAPQAPPGPARPADAAAPPPVEVITAPPPAPPAENGVSAIRDVTLEPGVPDLARGRRPVAPPFARMSGSTGNVEVSFSVGAGGTTTIQSVSGPELLKTAAEQTVASWTFRRARADRAYLVAVFSYTGDKSSAVVRPQAAPPSGTSAPPSTQAPTPGSAPTSTPTPPGS
jgi:TonB family protein